MFLNEIIFGRRSFFQVLNIFQATTILIVCSLSYLGGKSQNSLDHL